MNIVHRVEIATPTPDGGVVISVDTLEFEELSNGHLKCLECATEVWCEHIAGLVADEADAPALHDASKAPEFDIWLPIFPTLNIFQGVKCIKSEAFGALETAFLFRGGVENLGFIHPGEGRGTIRSLFFDWFTATYAHQVFECHSGSHKPAQEANLRKMMSQENSFLMARICIWNKEMCPPCVKANSDDFSDLIPGREGANPFGGK